MPLTPHEMISIESKAFDLIQQCNIGSCPVNLESISSYLGLTVTSKDLGEISGALVIENGRGFINYNPSHIKERKRFTIAHEIGHYCLHCSSSNDSKKDNFFVDKDFIVKYRNSTSYTIKELKQEQQANAFAAALLMPEQFIRRELNLTKHRKMDEPDLIKTLAGIFEVSVPAMTFRLDNLNNYLFR